MPELPPGSGGMAGMGEPSELLLVTRTFPAGPLLDRFVAGQGDVATYATGMVLAERSSSLSETARERLIQALRLHNGSVLKQGCGFEEIAFVLLARGVAGVELLHEGSEHSNFDYLVAARGLPQSSNPDPKAALWQEAARLLLEAGVDPALLTWLVPAWRAMEAEAAFAPAMERALRSESPSAEFARALEAAAAQARAGGQPGWAATLEVLLGALQRRVPASASWLADLGGDLPRPVVAAFGRRVPGLAADILRRAQAGEITALVSPPSGAWQVIRWAGETTGQRERAADLLARDVRTFLDAPAPAGGLDYWTARRRELEPAQGLIACAQLGQRTRALRNLLLRIARGSESDWGLRVLAMEIESSLRDGRPLPDQDLVLPRSAYARFLGGVGGAGGSACGAGGKACGK